MVKSPKQMCICFYIVLHISGHSVQKRYNRGYSANFNSVVESRRRYRSLFGVWGVKVGGVGEKSGAGSGSVVG